MPFSPETFIARRSHLMQSVGHGVIFLPGNPEAPMNYRGNVYPFRQDGSFRYFTGIALAGWALWLDVDAGSISLFAPPSHPDDVVWTGEIPGSDVIASSAGISDVRDATSLPALLKQAHEAGKAIHFLPPYRAEHTVLLAEALSIPPSRVAEHSSVALIKAVVAQRLVKDTFEVEAISRALGIAKVMHHVATVEAREGVSEYELAAAMEAAALRYGSHPSFPIIATLRGEVLHNHPTSARFQRGDLVLHDAGAVDPETGYCSDITRVTCVGGNPSALQRDLYDAVVRAQEAAIAACTVGTPFRDVHHLAARTLTEALIGLGFMQGDPEEATRAGAHALFFPHGLGHAMGLDVHDMEALGELHVGYGEGFERSSQFGTAYLRFARPLQPGYVMTVEPGFYVNPSLIARWEAENRHADFIRYDRLGVLEGFGGIRIEDNVLITPDGPVVLGPGIPKTL